MQDVRNSANKLVCRLDKQTKTIEIALKGCTTTIQFLENGQVLIQNANKVA